MNDQNRDNPILAEIREKGKKKMKGFVEDIKRTADFYGILRDARKDGSTTVEVNKVKMYTSVQVGLGFYSTVEGSSLCKCEKHIRDTVQKAYGEQPYEVKRIYCFSPKDGEFVERAEFWKQMMSEVLTEKELHTAMIAIIQWYIHIKSIGKQKTA